MPKDKIYRILRMYTQLLEGNVVKKNEAAEMYCVNTRSIQRDISDIRDFVEKRAIATSKLNSIVFDRGSGGYRMLSPETMKLSKSEILAICKILLDSRAFTKVEMDSILDKLIECCAASESQKVIRDLVANERFHYVEPNHRTNFVERIWDLGVAVKEHRLMEITYKRYPGEPLLNLKIKPVSLMFNEFYFYLIAYLPSQDSGDAREESGPAVYRIDRIEKFTVLEDRFNIPYSDRFEDGEFRKRIQFDCVGDLKKVRFRYRGHDLEGVLDRLPTAKIVSSEDGTYTLVADVIGDGVDAWLRGQDGEIEILN